MTAIQAHLSKISLSLEDRFLFGFDDLKIFSGDRIGIVGPNGAGKSSLLNLLVGDLKPTTGQVKRYSSLSYLKQVNKFAFMENYDLDYQLFSQFDLGETLFSGGEQQKLRLIEILSENPSLLLLDEPTNHLDETGLNFLLSWLENYRGTLVVVSHNRQFLNQICTKIWLLEDEMVKGYEGNYDAFLKQREVERLTNGREVEAYEKEKLHLHQVIENKKRQIQHIAVTDEKKERRINPGRLAASKDKKTVQKNMEKGVKAVELRLENLQAVKEMARDKAISFPDINFAPLHSKFPIMVDNLTLVRDGKILLEQVSFQVPKGKKLAIRGDNGSGKTSLLQAVLNQAPGVQVAQNVQFSVYQQMINRESDERTKVSDYIKADSNFSDEVIFAILEALGLEKSLNKSLAQLSGGQRTKLELAKVFTNQANILILDEPTNAIDLQTIQALEQLIKAYPGTVLFVSHDRDFVKSCADMVMTIRDKKLRLE